LWQYIDNVRERAPKNRMYLSWMDSTTHWPIILPPEWLEKNYRPYLKKTGDPSLWEEREHLPVDAWLNALKWTDDIVKEIILGFRERGLENETLFVMYQFPLMEQNINYIDMLIMAFHLPENGAHPLRTPITNHTAFL
jgi:hypothetical protein